MPEPVSATVGFIFGFTALNALARSTSAVSSEAQTVRYAATSVVSRYELSESLFGDRSLAIASLRQMLAECSESGWDGVEAMPVSLIAGQRAEDFIRALPEGLPMPEFAPEPDGAVSLDWSTAPYRQVSLSLADSDRIAYAWLDGSDRGHAVARFDGIRIPARILDCIRCVVNA